jgi:hypothetical protein
MEVVGGTAAREDEMHGIWYRIRQAIRRIIEGPASTDYVEDFEDAMYVDDDGNWLCESSEGNGKTAEAWIAPRGCHHEAFVVNKPLDALLPRS